MCWRTLYTVHPHVREEFRHPRVGGPPDLEVHLWGYHPLALHHPHLPIAHTLSAGLSTNELLYLGVKMYQPLNYKYEGS